MHITLQLCTVGPVLQMVQTLISHGSQVFTVLLQILCLLAVLNTMV